MAELVDAHVSGACAARRAGSIPVLGTIPIEDSAGGVIHFMPPVFLFMQVWGGDYMYGAQNEAYMSRSAEKWVKGLCFNELGVSG